MALDSPDSCDPGNYSDITEEREESKAQTPSSAKVVAKEDQEAKSEVAEPRGNVVKSHDTGSHNNHNRATVSSSGLIAQENSDSTLMGNKNHTSSEIYHHQSSDRQHQGPHSLGPNDSRPTNSFSTDVYNGLAQKDTSSSSRNKHDCYALVPHKPLELSGVLDSLRQAKLSLQQELNRLPPVDNDYNGKAIKTSASASKTQERLDIPIGCSGLFRLPTDFSDEVPTRSTAIDSASRFSSNLYPGKEILRTSVNQLGTGPYFGSRLNFSPDHHQSLATRSLESGSRFETKMPPFDPFLDAGLLASSNNKYPIYPSYQNLTPQMPFSDGLSRPYPSGPVGVPPADHFPLYDDHARQNVYM